MAVRPRVRFRGRELYVVGGYPAEEVARRCGVSRSTVKRWISEGGWTKARAQARELEQLAPKVAIELLSAAIESRDPQVTFAGLNAADVAGLRRPEQPHPPPDRVARELIAALAGHPEIGPAVRRNRGEIVRLVLARLEQMEPEAGA